MRSRHLRRFGLLILTSCSLVESQEKVETLHHLRTPRRDQEEDNTVDLEDGSTTVVGGTTATDGEFPFFALFGDLNCGGTLVSNQALPVTFKLFC